MDNILSSGLERMLLAVEYPTDPYLLISGSEWPDVEAAPPLPSVWQQEKHNYHELAYVDNGICTITLGEKACKVASGKLCIVAPGEVHYEAPANYDSGYRIYWLMACTTRMTLHITEYFPDQHALRHLITGVDTWLGCDLNVIFEKIINEMHSRRIFSEKVMRGYLMSLLGLSCRQLLAVAERGEIPQTGWQDPLVQTVVAHVAQNFSHPDFGVDKMAAHVAFSANYLSVYFRKHTGTSPYQYLLQTRMQRARELLATSDTSVADIASAVGFTSPYHFSATFKRLNGITPTVFRNEAGQVHVGELQVS